MQKKKKDNKSGGKKISRMNRMTKRIFIWMLEPSKPSMGIKKKKKDPMKGIMEMRKRKGQRKKKELSNMGKIRMIQRKNQLKKKKKPLNPIIRKMSHQEEERKRDL